MSVTLLIVVGVTPNPAPQHRALVPMIANDDASPLDSCVGMPVMLTTRRGCADVVCVPSPSRPPPFSPQQYTVLSSSSAHVCSAPALISTGFAMPYTTCGTVCCA